MTYELKNNFFTHKLSKIFQKHHWYIFSNVVKKNFVVPSPRFHPEQHINTLIEIIEQENIELFIPVWEDIFLISKNLNRFPSSCKIVCSEFSLLHRITGG